MFVELYQIASYYFNKSGHVLRICQIVSYYFDKSGHVCRIVSNHFDESGHVYRFATVDVVSYLNILIHCDKI